MTKEFYEIFSNVSAVIIALIFLVPLVAFTRSLAKKDRETEEAPHKRKAPAKRKKNLRIFKASQGFF